MGFALWDWIVIFHSSLARPPPLVLFIILFILSFMIHEGFDAISLIAIANSLAHSVFIHSHSLKFNDKQAINFFNQYPKHAIKY